MSQQRAFGPESPSRLVTIQLARRRDYRFLAWCGKCHRAHEIEGRRLPELTRTLAIGELWLAGRFRCSRCNQPATTLRVVETGMHDHVVETWAVGDPFIAERLRRHWRHDPYDRRDWEAYFRR